MADGYSFESFAGLVKVSKQCIYDWVKDYPDFFDAKKEATERCRLFWEQKGMEGLFNLNDKEAQINKTFNTTNWIFQMKNRFDWRDKKDTEVTGNVELGVNFYLPDNGRD